MRELAEDRQVVDVSEDVRTLLEDGIVALRGAFGPAWMAALREDIDAAFARAQAREGGAVPRGPQRWYVEIHPEEMRGFVDLASHPWVVAMCEQVLGERYEIVEVGFDIPFPGAANQPWHRDFPPTRPTIEEHRLTSLAFNLTAVDTTPEMGPMELAPGTHWEPGFDFTNSMFPPETEWPRYASMARPMLPRAGDISARTALAIHRGTANRSSTPRPVLVLGVDGPEADDLERHDMTVSERYHAELPAVVRDHLGARVVDELTPIVQKHMIEGLLTESGY